MDQVKCPKCNSSHFIRKGKTKNKQFQRLQCKSCNKRFQVETSIVNRQTQLPYKELRIVKHPDGAFSINVVRFVDVGKKNKHTENEQYLISKVQSYKGIIALAKEFSDPIDPHDIELDRLLSDSLIHEIKIAFQPNISQQIINLLENMARGLKWSDND